jgi:hypothetical protein
MLSDSAKRPWATLPPEVANRLRPALPALSDEIIEAIRREVDAYRRPLEGPFGQAVRLGTERALNRFLDLIADPGSDDAVGRTIYVELGRTEFREGRSLDALLAAYRLGARLAWRRFAEEGEAAGLPPPVMYRLGEAIFAYIDGLSGESAEGFAEAQSAAAGERERRRRDLVALLSQRPAAGEGVVRGAAERAGWSLPDSLAALVSPGDDEVQVATRLGSDVVAVTLDGVVLALVPDPEGPGRRGRIERLLRGQRAALGPAVPWRDALRSIERARLAERLASQGFLPSDGLIASEDHLPALLLHADRSLAEDLAARYLAPFGSLQPKARARLEETLRVWLDHRGRVEEAAGHLGVHPQTVRYRLTQLRELFGPRLEDPDERLAIALALRVRSAGSRLGGEQQSPSATTR